MTNSIVKPVFRAILNRATRLWLAFSLTRHKSTAPTLLYAGQASPNSCVSGGAVKLKYLSRHFPDCSRTGNILYFVSSALPRNAMGWADAAKAKKIKLVLNQNGVAYPAWASPAQMKSVNAKMRSLLETADYVIYQSQFCRLSCNKWVAKPTAASTVIYNPVDTSLFKRSESSMPKVDFLLAGSCSQPERIRLPLEMLAIARAEGLPWRVRIAGKLLWKNAEADLERWTSELGLGAQIERIGSYMQEEAPQIFSAAKVLIHMQDKDASPTVPLEAMACGLPVIGIASGGMPELIPASLGQLLNVEDTWDKFSYPTPESLLHAASSILQRHPQLSEGCIHHVKQNFSLEKFVAAHAEIFNLNFLS